jgi:hypothetical protein
VARADKDGEQAEQGGRLRQLHSNVVASVLIEMSGMGLVFQLVVARADKDVEQGGASQRRKTFYGQPS